MGIARLAGKRNAARPLLRGFGCSGSAVLLAALPIATMIQVKADGES